MARVVHLQKEVFGAVAGCRVGQVAAGECWGMPREGRTVCCTLCVLAGMFAFMASISQELMFKLPGCPCIHVLLDCIAVSFMKNKCESTCATSGQGLKPWLEEHEE